MKFNFVVLLLLCFNFSSAQSLSPRNANYKISANLNTITKTITGEQELTWTNISQAPTQELQFHLYLNAFKDAESTFMRESNSRRRSIDKEEFKKNNGSQYISYIKIKNGVNLYPTLTFIQPDDLNDKDKTVCKVTLPTPIKPNETIVLEIGFKAKLPKIIARTGWSEQDYFLVGQWFPKIGVLENDRLGGSAWNCHQFHANTEFFADFGNYDVSIVLPKKYIVGGTGSKISEINLKNGLKTVKFQATDVHDFAFTASSKFEVTSTTYKGIKIMAYMQPEHKAVTNRYIESAKKSIDYLQKNVGPYPHKTLSLIDPPMAGAASSGMEYPTFITCGSSWGVGSWAKFSEVVTIHEFAHQYFQGMLASNEFEESWLDEGFTQYFEGKIMDEYFSNGSQVNFLGFTLNDMAGSRNGYVNMENPRIAPSYMPAWNYPGGTYGVLTYQKTATWLKTLEGYLGKGNMEIVFKKYYNAFAFKHPKAKDFIEIVNEVSRSKTNYGDMNWFFDQVLFGKSTCDYAVTKIVNAERKKEPSGYFTVTNNGDMKLPTTIKVVFDNKTYRIVKWSGQENQKEFKFNNRIKYVEIDPDKKNWMDLNMINNSKATSDPTKAASKFALKFLFWLQNIFFFGSPIV